MIEGFFVDFDLMLCYGGVFMVVMVYCGIGSNKVICKFFYFVVSDVNDDVCCIVVMFFGFIFFCKFGSVFWMVEFFVEFYNFYVWYGFVMVLGILCVGIGLDEVIDLFEFMMKDFIDFVCQGVLIVLFMIMIQQNEVMNFKVVVIRKIFKKVVGDCYEDVMIKFGVVVVMGILDVGGCNCLVGFQMQIGNFNMFGIVGMVVFMQYWYWFFFIYFLLLSFVFIFIIGFDYDFEIFSFKFYCNICLSLFDYFLE